MDDSFVHEVEHKGQEVISTDIWWWPIYPFRHHMLGIECRRRLSIKPACIKPAPNRFHQTGILCCATACARHHGDAAAARPADKV